MTILQINTSLFSGDGQSTRLADQFTAALRAENPVGASSCATWRASRCRT